MGDRDGCHGDFVLWYIRGPYHWPVRPNPHLVRLYDLGPVAGDCRSPPAQHCKAPRVHAQPVLLGLGVAGLFTFLPGRRMNTVFFADAPMVGFTVVAVLIGSVLLRYAYVNRRATRA